jgi:hypothetical protein
MLRQPRRVPIKMGASDNFRVAENRLLIPRLDEVSNLEQRARCADC